METRFLQVASSFTSIPIARTLRPLIVNTGIADELSFAQYAQMTEYMLSSASDSRQHIGTIIFLRVEDWLREDLKSSSFGSTSEVREKVRQRLRTYVDEFSSQLRILLNRGKPVWFLACPSAGWISDKYKLEVLCRTYTNFLVARVEDLPEVTVLKWPSSVLPDEPNDRNADRLGQIPFTIDAFNQLGEFVGKQVARTLADKPLRAQTTPLSGSPELAAYLAGLRVHVRLTPAEGHDRAHVDRLLRTAATFSLTGENPDMPDADVDALLKSGRCMLISVSDRLSDHGPSGLITFRATEGSLVVDSMALSCPVLGKQVEFAVLLALAQIASDHQSAQLAFEYRPSGRNQPMLTFLRSVANAESNTRYVLPVNLAETRTRQVAVASGTWTLDFPRSLPYSKSAVIE